MVEPYLTGVECFFSIQLGLDPFISDKFIQRLRPLLINRFGTNVPPSKGTPFRHQVSVCLIILIAEEGFLPTISTLGYVVGKTRSHYSRNSYHKIKSYLYCYYVKK